MRIRWAWVGWVALAVSGAAAQTAKKAEKALRTELVNHRFFLQSFSADSESRYEWTTEGFKLRSPQLHTLAVLEPKSVNFKGSLVEVQGRRSTMVMNEGGQYAMSGGSPATVLVELNRADPATELPLLSGLLFFSRIDDAVDAVPPLYRSLLPYKIGLPLPGRTGTASAEESSCGSNKVVPPKLISAVDPVYSGQAKANRFNGKVVMIVTVDKTGHVANPWVGEAAGLGLDEEASKAVLQYSFKPATCAGMPVPVALSIEVSFSMK